MKKTTTTITLAAFAGIMALAQVSFARGSNQASCLLIQTERQSQMQQLRVTPSQRNELLRQCISSKKVYWFSTDLYLMARAFGDSHEMAIGELGRYEGINFTLTAYKKMRSYAMPGSVKAKRDQLRLFSNLTTE